MKIKNMDIKLANKFINDVFKRHLITLEQKQKLIKIVEKHNGSLGMNILFILVGILLKESEKVKKEEVKK